MQRILVIEDDIDIQDILKNHLTDAGYEVVIADDGVAGIAKFESALTKENVDTKNSGKIWLQDMVITGIK